MFDRIHCHHCGRPEDSRQHDEYSGEQIAHKFVMPPIVEKLKTLVTTALAWQDAENYVRQHGTTGPEGQPLADAHYNLNIAIDHVRREIK